MQNIDSTYESWDKKRLAIGVFLLLIFSGLVLGVKSYLGNNSNGEKKLSKIFGDKVKGENIKESNDQTGQEKNNIQLSLPKSTDLQERLEIIKKEVNTINITEIASSSPQIQKVLLDLKNLEEYPKNQVKEACYNICKGL